MPDRIVDMPPAPPAEAPAPPPLSAPPASPPPQPDPRVRRMFWFSACPNFGDVLGPWFAERITGVAPEAGDPINGTILSCGSIMNWAGPGSIVWGSGIADQSHVVHPDAKILASRGPISRARAQHCGAVCSDVVGDPGLLLPRFLPDRSPGDYDLALVPHISDMDSMTARQWPNWVSVIDLLAPIEEVAIAISSAKRVVTSSLHGLIAAHAYGIPVALVRFGDGLMGDGMKFLDHLAAVGLPERPPIDLRSGFSDEDLAVLPFDVADPDRIHRIAEALWACCPLR